MWHSKNFRPAVKHPFFYNHSCAARARSNFPPGGKAGLGRSMWPAIGLTPRGCGGAMLSVFFRNRPCRQWEGEGAAGWACLRVGKIPDTQFLNTNYLNSDPKYPNPNYPITILDSDRKNPKLFWVTRVMFSGTRTTRITWNISNICSSIPNTKTWGSSIPYKYIIRHELM
jgi:hypothetical protein